MTEPRTLTPEEVDEIERYARNGRAHFSLERVLQFTTTIRLQAAEITRLQSDVSELMQAGNEQAGRVEMLDSVLATLARSADGYANGGENNYSDGYATARIDFADAVRAYIAALNPIPEKT
jgi:hypothetical protein